MGNLEERLENVVFNTSNAMILPAIDEIAQKIQAWLCPVCAAKLPENIVSQLKDGKTVVCPFCGVSINR
jgi:rubrerythrin